MSKENQNQQQQTEQRELTYGELNGQLWRTKQSRQILSDKLGQCEVELSEAKADVYSLSNSFNQVMAENEELRKENEELKKNRQQRRASSKGKAKKTADDEETETDHEEATDKPH